MWATKYIGQQFEPHGCVEFVQEVLNKEFNYKFNFPKHSGNYFNDIDRMNNYIGENLIETREPKDGDIVLMDGVRIGCHVGIYVAINGISHVLHGEIKTSCSCLHRISEIKNYGYSLNRFLKWK